MGQTAESPRIIVLSNVGNFCFEVLLQLGRQDTMFLKLLVLHQYISGISDTDHNQAAWLLPECTR